MSPPRRLVAHPRTVEEAVLVRVRAAVIAVPAFAAACGALALRGSPQLALLSVAVALGWTRLTDP